MTAIAPSPPLTEAEVKAFVVDWYQKLDVHAPPAEVVPLVSTTDLEMRFPEATLTTQAEFHSWYDGVTRIFFDEVHELKELRISSQGNRADVQLVVYWQARRWNPPAAQSEQLAFDADQTWVVERSPETQQPVVTRYIVNALTPVGGSAAL